MTQFLKGSRFNQSANEVLRMPTDQFNSLDLESDSFVEMLQKLIDNHRTNQLPRLQELKRYYLADNNINYRPKKTDEDAADNRIASDFGRYITTFEQGYMLGKPVEYNNEDAELLDKIKEFSIENNEDYHNVLIKTDLSIYGRAYELVSVEGDENKTQVTITKLDPQNTFVVYDDTVKNNSLFGVRYYQMAGENNTVRYFAEVYTNNAIYYYSSNGNTDDNLLRYKETEESSFNGVQINEFANNEDRTGAFESVLDSIDAYDLSQSELANYQQDTIDAMLVITGNPYTGTDEQNFDENGQVNPNSRLGVTKAFKKARVMILDDNPNPEGSSPNVFYLVKEYDTEGAEKYKERLVNDILRFTFTPDTTDRNFGGVQSGESMKYKLMGSDNRRVTEERIFAKGLMRRLRLAANIWVIKGSEAVAYDKINKTNITFTPNVPEDNKQLIQFVKDLYGVISDETLFELLTTFTGVDAENEMKRLKEDSEELPVPRIGGEVDEQGTA